MDTPEGRQKASEQKTTEPEYDPQEQEKKRYWAKFNRRAHDEFGRPVRHVVITDIQIPFGSLVGLLVELVLAAIPAIIILGLMFEAAKWLWMFFAAIRH